MVLADNMLSSVVANTWVEAFYVIKYDLCVTLAGWSFSATFILNYCSRAFWSFAEDCSNQRIILVVKAECSQEECFTNINQFSLESLRVYTKGYFPTLTVTWHSFSYPVLSHGRTFRLVAHCKSLLNIPDISFLLNLKYFHAAILFTGDVVHGHPGWQLSVCRCFLGSADASDAADMSGTASEASGMSGKAAALGYLGLLQQLHRLILQLVCPLLAYLWLPHYLPCRRCQWLFGFNQCSPFHCLTR